MSNSLQIGSHVRFQVGYPANWNKSTATGHVSSEAYPTPSGPAREVITEHAVPGHSDGRTFYALESSLTIID